MKLHESMFPIVINSIGNSLVTFTSPTDGAWLSGLKVSAKHDLDYFLSRSIEKPDQYIVESVGGHKFPITFYCGGDTGLITFDSFNNGDWHCGNNTPSEKTKLSIAHFFEMDYKVVDYKVGDNSTESIFGDIFAVESHQECAIEDMPLGAKLLGFYHDGKFVEISLSPSGIEVHDNSYTLLLRYGVSPSRVLAEVNLKRGEMVRYEK